MTISLNINEGAIFKALGDFLSLVVIAGTVVERGQANRVAPPAAVNYVVMIPLYQERISTNLDQYPYVLNVTANKTVQQDTKVTVQVDTYGPLAGDNAQLITSLFFDEFGCNSFSASGFDMQPLFSSQPRQEPFSDSNQQVEEHWYITLTMQVNPIVTMPQQFATHIGPVGMHDIL